MQRSVSAREAQSFILETDSIQNEDNRKPSIETAVENGILALKKCGGDQEYTM